MNKSYNWDKSSDKKRFSRDMAKLAEKKAESIKKEIESSYVFPQRPNMNFQYSPTNENPLYDTRKIRCPKCFKVIGVKIGTNRCAWCNHKFEATENSAFLK